VQALVSGADDFLSAPFAAEEFVARARALIRRSGLLTYGPIRLNTLQRIAYVDRKSAALTAAEFDLLVVMVRHAGALATRSELVGAAGRRETVRHSNWLHVHMSAIRQKLGMHAKLIETVRGKGYRLRSPSG
jgi:DNA-binding response OmpR family regulator